MKKSLIKSIIDELSDDDILNFKIDQYGAEALVQTPNGAKVRLTTDAKYQWKMKQK